MDRKMFNYEATVMHQESGAAETYPISVFWSPNCEWVDHCLAVTNAAAAQRTVETRQKYIPVTAKLLN